MISKKEETLKKLKHILKDVCRPFFYNDALYGIEELLNDRSVYKQSLEEIIELVQSLKDEEK